MKISKDHIVGELVAKDYRTASVFKAHGIDFCCRGNRSLEEVCDHKQIDTGTLIGELEQTMAENRTGTQDFQSWDMDLLADYIEKKHHRYVERKIPELRAYLHKVAKVHGERHPEVIRIAQLFDESAEALQSHMLKEETILFPFVRKVAANATEVKPAFGTVENPVRVMMQEHDNEGSRFREIAELSDNYTPPEDACTTYRVAYAMLKEFEEDLHLHIHLENNILFPKAIRAEKELSFA